MFPNIISISHSLPRLLPPSHSLESSSSKLICAGPGWHISARRAVKFFNLDFPSVVQTPLKYESIFPERTPLLVCRYSTLHSVPLSYPCQPFTLTHNHPICTAFYMVTDLTHRSTSFQPPTHKGPSENSLIYSTPTGGIRSVRLLLRWISRLFLSEFGNEVSDSMSQ